MTPEFISAIADIAWPVFFVCVLIYLRKEIKRLFASGSEIAFEFMGSSLSVKPSRAMTTESPDHEANPTELELASDVQSGGLPADYLYLKHTSFLRPKMQADFQARTGIQVPHYDIHVIVGSYYKGAIQSIDRVEYYLHRSYPEPIKVRTSPEDNFLLKEVANGEYVIQAKVFIQGRKHPLVLQRYLTLWETGPNL